MKTDTISNVPGAARLIGALRDIGYTINQAIAELIDNSISHGEAANIKIYFKRENDRHFQFWIYDDGKGMTDPELINAMRFGSEMVYGDDNLGKFGMGLKSASFSQCRKFSVISHPASQPTTGNVYGYEWDYDKIIKSNTWQMDVLSKDYIKQCIQCKDLIKSPGTVVIWENLDKLDKRLEKAVKPDIIAGNITSKLEFFIRMIYHMFLENKLINQEKLRIFLNDKELSPWDPFCKNEKNTLKFEEINFNLPEVSSNQPLVIQPYILPAKEGSKGFSNNIAWTNAKGLLSWNDSQGLYIYRNNRLIKYGGWSGVRAKDEHTKYARISILFKTSHDDAFNTAMDKSRIQLPESLFKFLKEEKIFIDFIKQAKDRYRSENESVVDTKNKILLGGKSNKIDEKSKHGDIHSFQDTNKSNGITEILKFKIIDDESGTDRLWDIDATDSIINIALNKKIEFFSQLNNSFQKEEYIKIIEFLIGYIGFVQKYPQQMLREEEFRSILKNFQNE